MVWQLCFITICFVQFGHPEYFENFSVNLDRKRLQLPDRQFGLSTK